MLFIILLRKEIYIVNICQIIFPYWKDVLISGPKLQRAYPDTLDDKQINKYGHLMCMYL